MHYAIIYTLIIVISWWDWISLAYVLVVIEWDPVAPSQWNKIPNEAQCSIEVSKLGMDRNQQNTRKRNAYKGSSNLHVKPRFKGHDKLIAL